jgi:hypothetical protein
MDLCLWEVFVIGGYAFFPHRFLTMAREFGGLLLLNRRSNYTQRRVFVSFCLFGLDATTDSAQTKTLRGLDYATNNYLHGWVGWEIRM